MSPGHMSRLCGSDVPLIRRVEGPWGMCCICGRFITVWTYYGSYHVTCPTLIPRPRDFQHICLHHCFHICLQTWRQTSEIMTKTEYGFCPSLQAAVLHFTGSQTWRTRTNWHPVQGLETIMETWCEKSVWHAVQAVVQSELCYSLHSENDKGSICKGLLRVLWLFLWRYLKILLRCLQLSSASSSSRMD